MAGHQSLVTYLGITPYPSVRRPMQLQAGDLTARQYDVIRKLSMRYLECRQSGAAPAARVISGYLNVLTEAYDHQIEGSLLAPSVTRILSLSPAEIQRFQAARELVKEAKAQLDAGNPRETLALLDEASRLYNDIGVREEVRFLGILSGNIAHSIKDYVLADRYCQAVRDAYSSGTPDHLMVKCLGTLGVTRRRLLRYEQARQLFSECLKYQVKRRLYNDAWRTMNYLGNYWGDSGSVDGAMCFFNLALAYGESLDDPYAIRISAHNCIDLLVHETDDFDRAKSYLGKVESAVGSTAPTALLDRFSIAYHAGSCQEARAAVKALDGLDDQDVSGGNDTAQDYRKSLVSLICRESIPLSRDVYEASLGDALASGSISSALDTAVNAALYCRFLGDDEGAGEYYLRAYELLANVDLVELDQSRSMYLQAERSIYDGLTELQIVHRKDVLTALNYIESYRSRNLVKRLSEEGGDAFTVRFDTQAALVQQVIAQLAGRAQVIYIHSIVGAVFVFLIKDGMVLVETLKVTPEQMEEATQRLLTAIAGHSDEFSEPAERLGELLLEPFADHLEAEQPLFFIASGAIAAIPFAVLPFPGHRGSCLMEFVPVGSIPSLISLHQLTQTARPLPSRPRCDYCGICTYPSGSLLRSLPAVGAEVGVLRVMDTAPFTFHLDARCSKASILDLRGLSDILHITSHGYVDAIHPRLSYFQLYPVDEHDPGRLYFDEVAAGNTHPQYLMFLASCYSGAGCRMFGEDLVGMSWGFQATGTPRVVASLWDVADTAAVVTMIEAFYRSLFAGSPAYEALRRGQMAIRAKGAGLTHPYYWAGFRYSGVVD
ncbi:CHAT domain-containing protein [bacterium]|nr:CHAT domain-containing protein [candidate division CSSED10-310 bacterium]